MHPSEINSCLRKNGLTQTAVARELNLKQSTVATVIRGQSKSRKVAEFIALAVGYPLDVLWPGKYGDATRRLSKKQPNLRARLIAELDLNADASDDEIVATVTALKHKVDAAHQELSSLTTTPDPAEYVPIAVTKDLQADIDQLKIHAAELDAAATHQDGNSAACDQPKNTEIQ